MMHLSRKSQKMVKVNIHKMNKVSSEAEKANNVSWNKSDVRHGGELCE